VIDYVNEKCIVDYDDVSTAEEIIYQGKNGKDQPLGNPIKIPRSSGGGNQTGSTLNIYPESQSVWGAFGGKITLRAAIKSVSFDGDDEILGTIKTVSILDPLTNMVLWTDSPNITGSVTASDYKFEFDFTDFITEASTKEFLLEAIDADGNRKTKQVSVNAVDVTVQAVNSLNYSADKHLAVGGATMSISMYKFANNISTRQGILCTTEMFYNGEWRVLGTATITDNYSHNISINPNDVFGGGEKLTHGSYPLRIHGRDLASGVEGNTVYTAVMCVDPNSSKPLVSMRYDDRNNGKVRLYDSISVDIAAYTPGRTTTAVEVILDGQVVSTVNCDYSQTYNVSKQIQGYASNGTVTLPIHAQSKGTGVAGSIQRSVEIEVTVDGSAIDAALKDGAVVTYDFSTRSNDEADHTISNNGYLMSVIGSNWNSNGFVNILGENVLRIAENVKAEIPYAPFASTALETSGCAIQMAFSTKNIKDKNAKLCECYDPSSGVGFYILGNKIVLNVQNGTPTTQNVKFKCNEKITLAIVVEPGSKTVTYKSDDSATGTDYSFVKMYVNGDEVAAIGYQPNTNALRQNRTITFDSTNGDFCLNYFIAYNSHMEWLQAFRNYLCKMSDVTAMIAEYDKENVLDTTGRPSMSLMAAAGIPYYVIVADQTTFDNYDFALNGGTSTSDVFSCTLYYFNPEHPEVNFKSVNTYWRRQGTTSAQRPIKNDRFNFNKKFKTGPLAGLKATVTLLNPDESTQLGRDAILAAKHNKVYCSETGFFVDVVTVKVDYSDSSTANDCGVCNMMNATFRALGSSYMTPAQRAFTGIQDLGGGDVITARQMDHSTKNHPIACFRATTDTLQDAWFHARGNWKEDKGEQVALGFKDTPGYNLGCLNYGDFVEFFGNSVWENGEFKSQETLAEIEARFKKTADLDTSKVYLLSQYCGQDYAIYRYKNGSWVRSTGSMKQVNGQWVITGDVLNPVTGYELLQYNGMDWFQGVSSITDMMKPSTRIASWVNKLDNKPANPPAWTYYFECMVDDDQLQEDLAFGRKVPYDLFNLLRFMDSCDYSKTSLASTWKNIWKENAYKYMSLESAMTYTAFTDFLAAVDQRAKNMQPMFFLEDGCSVENGVYVGYKGMNALRMYLNKVYDCDTCNGADNDGGRDIDAEVDPNKDSDAATGYVNPYMGRGSILFNNIDKQPELWNSNDLGNTTITLQNVVNTMRTRTAQVDGKTMVPFSPDGAMYYFVEQRLNFWPKTVATYDCERKYIENTPRANLPYFYALHGLGLTSLPRFIEQRWSIRDCYYKTGDFYTNPLKVRMVALNANSKIPFTAGQTGYFGIGNDAGGATSEFVFLEEGQSHEFTIFEHGECEMSIYQVGRMSRLDLSEMCLGSNINTQLSKLALAEEIILGGEKHTANISTGGYGEVGSLDLQELPFLRKLDVSHTTCSGIDASKCPRIEEINAKDTNVARCDVAQTAPIETMVLPSAVSRLDLVNLPKLTYPGGLELASVGNITHLRIEGCPYVDTEGLTLSVAQTGKLKEIRIPDVNITASVNVLRLLKQAGVQGLSNTGSAYGEEGKCSGLIGRWILSELIDEDGTDGLNSLNAYFPELNIINSQFSMVVYNDAEDDCENISNLDNKTGYLFGNEFVPSGHVKRLEEMSHGVRGTYDTEQEAMIVEELSDEDYNLLADGTSIDLTDSSGMGYDFFKDVPDHWYKGVNDFKNQQKYGIRSICEDEPISTATKVTRAKLADLLVEANSALVLSANPIGGEPNRSLNSAMNVYEMNVEGMRQVRWPGINNDAIGCVFLDADGRIMSQFKMAVSHAQFDFIAGEDYIFTDVPSGAVKFMFTSQIGCDEQEAIAVDSSAIEAIEPDWVRSKEFLVGIYGMGQDGLNRARSISGTKAVVGTGTSTTSSAWTYDSEGNVTNLSVPANLNRTRQDCINLCEMRGKGFHAISWHQSTVLANIIMELTGTRDIQSICGRGNSAGYTTGGQTINGKNINAYGNITLRHNAGNVGNLMFGIQEFVACNYEWTAHAAVNVSSFKDWKAKKCPTSEASYPINGKWHIYDISTDSERVIQGLTSNSGGQCIGRVRFGRFMDVVPAKLTSDTSQYNKNYSDGSWYTHDRCRVVGRANNYGNALGGLVCSSANNVSTSSHTYYGSRLAFSGKIIHKNKQAA
ncbi:MAG: hypothetical protein NC311_12800, partial [Muribaculaceae bacterium]|nr:hypothetical protein [Muribaculaceae bacterium]